MSRTEFGRFRSVCHCNECVLNCRYIPGFLIPSDLNRLIPEGVDAFEWARVHLRASPGATVMDRLTGKRFQIPTLVPATIEGSFACHWLDVNNKCTVHADAPFGCAFFSCKISSSEADQMSMMGLAEIIDCNTLTPPGLYVQIWRDLNHRGLRAADPDTKRVAMRLAYLHRNNDISSVDR